PLAAARALAPATAVAAAVTASAADLLAQARSRADVGDYPAAIAACDALLAAAPDSADAYFILGMVSECEQQPGAADNYWRRCVYLQPDHYEALCHLALLAAHNGQAAQARAWRQRAERIYRRRQAGAGAAS
ncbi:MAG: methyltransferase, partial [Pseudomonadota bacterium]|nr:methyltransferase [Pseudomonadota bacterium]